MMKKTSLRAPKDGFLLLIRRPENHSLFGKWLYGLMVGHFHIFQSHNTKVGCM